jgi:hypothetical protein
MLHDNMHAELIALAGALLLCICDHPTPFFGARASASDTFIIFPFS